MVGGDHSVTIPVERGISDAADEEFGIIHIDAHMDLSFEMDGDKLAHGRTEQRALELDHVKSFGKTCTLSGFAPLKRMNLHFIKKNDIQVKLPMTVMRRVSKPLRKTVWRR